MHCSKQRDFSTKKQRDKTLHTCLFNDSTHRTIGYPKLQRETSNRAAVAQLVEHCAVTQEVVSSTPPGQCVDSVLQCVDTSQGLKITE